MTYREQILAIVSKHIPSGSKTVDETLTLEELGLASLDVLEIIFEIEETFQIQVPGLLPVSWTPRLGVS
jgi:acyl carrier protein